MNAKTKLQNEKQSDRHSDYTLGLTVGYLYARTESDIIAVRNTIGGTHSRYDIARRLGEVISNSAGGNVVDGSEPVPVLRGRKGKAPKRNAKRPPAKKVHDGAHRASRRPLTLRDRRYIHQLREQQMTHAEIAKRTGRAISVVARVLGSYVERKAA